MQERFVVIFPVSTGIRKIPRVRAYNPSMSRRGNCWDNAAMESFFSTLKTERLGRRQYRTRDELRADVFDYGVLSPNQRNL